MPQSGACGVLSFVVDNGHYCLRSGVMQNHLNVCRTISMWYRTWCVGGHRVTTPSPVNSEYYFVYMFLPVCSFIYIMLVAYKWQQCHPPWKMFVIWCVNCLLKTCLCSDHAMCKTVPTTDCMLNIYIIIILLSTVHYFTAISYNIVYNLFSNTSIESAVHCFFNQQIKSW